MKLNPEFLVWDEPQNTISGDPIPDDRELQYEVGVVGAAGADPGEVTPLMVVPAQLRGGTQYEAPIADIGLSDGEHELVLRSFYKSDTELKSKWSDSVTFRIDGSVPESPLGLSVD